MKLYTFKKGEIIVKDLTPKPSKIKEKKFDDPGRKETYKIVQWDGSWILMKWNGEKYIIFEKSNKKKVLEDKIEEDKHYIKLKKQLDDLKNEKKREEVFVS